MISYAKGGVTKTVLGNTTYVNLSAFSRYQIPAPLLAEIAAWAKLPVNGVDEWKEFEFQEVVS